MVKQFRDSTNMFVVPNEKFGEVADWLAEHRVGHVAYGVVCMIDWDAPRFARNEPRNEHRRVWRDLQGEEEIGVSRHMLLLKIFDDKHAVHFKLRFVEGS